MKMTLLRMYIGQDEFEKVITSNQTRLSNPRPNTEAETPKPEVPKVNKKSFLFGEINSILESRKPTEEDQKKINQEFGEYLKSLNSAIENEPVVIETDKELKKNLGTTFTEVNVVGKFSKVPYLAIHG